jgi:hypothetical protein
LKFRINRIEDRNGDGFITPDDYINTPPSQDSVIFRCKDLGITYVQLWVGEESTDNVNNWDYCVTFIEVQDNLGACGSGSKYNLGGKITNEDDESVEDVMVEVSTGASMMTSNDGAYNFTNLPAGGDYTVTPSRDDDPRNGVSTFDLVLISKHVLNVKKLDSPYKIIAADANNSGSVSTLDMVVLRKLILFVSNDLPNNTSWRFVDKSHVFADIQNPWGFPEVKNYNDLAGNQLSGDFIAVKIGDVNGDAVPNSMLGVGNRSFRGTFELQSEEQQVKTGEIFEVGFKAGSDVSGYQFTLDYNTTNLELLSIGEGVAKADNFHANTEKGQIATSWNGEQSIAGQEMFRLTFKAKQGGQLSDLLKATSAMTVAEAYEGTELKNVTLSFGGQSSDAAFTLYQNTPNPFNKSTVIGFDLPEGGEVTLIISDLSGKVVKVVNGEYSKGYNQVELKRSDLPANGVYTYQLESGKYQAVKKMVLMN